MEELNKKRSRGAGPIFGGVLGYASEGDQTTTLQRFQGGVHCRYERVQLARNLPLSVPGDQPATWRDGCQMLSRCPSSEKQEQTACTELDMVEFWRNLYYPRWSSRRVLARIRRELCDTMMHWSDGRRLGSLGSMLIIVHASGVHGFDVYPCDWLPSDYLVDGHE